MTTLSSITSLNKFAQFVDTLTVEKNKIVKSNYNYEMHQIVNQFKKVWANKERTTYKPVIDTIITKIQGLQKDLDDEINALPVVERILPKMGTFFKAPFSNSKKILQKIECENNALSTETAEVESVAEQGVFKRKYPPISPFDTVIVINNKVQSIHGQGLCFQDNEIISISSYTERELLNAPAVKTPTEKKDLNAVPSPFYDLFSKMAGGTIYAYKTEDQKFVIQQQATRGCTAAAAAMLIKDNNGTVDIKALISRNLGDAERMIGDIKKAGFIPIHTTIKKLHDIQQALQDNGPAIVSINDNNLGSHVIVVDAIERNSVRLRDPYHGWQITVSGKAFKKRLHHYDYMIQIKAT